MTGPRFLLITLSNIGDAVMTTPVLQALHAHDPAAVIDIVGDRRSSSIFAACEYVGRIVHKEKRLALRGLGALLGELRGTRYDLIVDLRTDFVPLLLRARRRLYRWSGRALGPHAVQRHLGVIRALPLPAGEWNTMVWLGAAQRQTARGLLHGFDGRRLLALGPGANSAPKIWPAQRFIDLLGKAGDRFDAIVLLGNGADAACAGSIAASAPLPCLDLAGKTGLLEAAAILAEARVFIGNDSGLGHLAAAVGTPTLTLFGVGDPHRYHPWGSRARWIVEPARDIARLPVDAVAAVLADMTGG
ncbi:MAG: glycosyltransferase family 9 protein [Gammaproteobacteria bacterium]|nr:glycosyltransferase family 9 protein [Gammaproteobacteria bacterium]